MEKDYNIRQAAELLGIKVRTVRQWIADGKIRAKKYSFSRRWFISADEIMRVKGEQTDGKESGGCA